MTTISRIVLCFAVLVVSSSASATESPVEKFFKDVRDGFKQIFSGQPSIPESAIKPQLSAPRDGKRLDPSKFYIVEFKCAVNADVASLLSEGLLIKQQTFTTQSLWLSDTVTDGNVPQNPAKLVNIYSFQKDATGQLTEFDNKTCSDTILLSGKSSKLTFSFSVTETKSLGTFPTIFYSFLKIASGVAPLFFEGPLLATITKHTTAIGGTDDPVKEIVTAINKSGIKAVVSTNLLTGTRPTVIETAYSKVTIKVTLIENISDAIAKRPDFRTSFNSTVDTIASAQLAGLSEANAKNNCAAFAALLVKSYTFSKKDSSFIIGYFAQSGFPGSVEARLGCIGNRSNAEDVVNFQFFYNKSSGALHAITQKDIDNYFSNLGFPETRLNSTIAHGYISRLVNQLSSYAQTNAQDSAELKKALLNWLGPQPIMLDDNTGKFSLVTESLNAEALLAKLTQGEFKRFGCFILKPTVGAGGYDASILALPLKGDAAAGATSLDKVVALKIIVDGTGNRLLPAVLKAVQVTNQEVEILEAANKHKGKCENGATILLPSPTS